MAWSLIAHTLATANATSSVTTAAINTTGADLIVVAGSVYEAALPITFTDNKSNGNATKRTNYATATNGSIQIGYWSVPTVGSGHTFTVAASATIFGCLMVAAFSGSASSSVYDTENGSAANSQTSKQPGSITPAGTGELIISALNIGDVITGSVAVDSSLTITDQVNNTVGNHFGGALAYLFDGSATAINPNWSWTGSADAAASIAAFKAAAVGFTAVNRRTLGPRVGSRSYY